MLNAANPLARVFKADYNRNQERETILRRFYSPVVSTAPMTFAVFGNRSKVAR